MYVMERPITTRSFKKFSIKTLTIIICSNFKIDLGLLGIKMPLICSMRELYKLYFTILYDTHFQRFSFQLMSLMCN